MVVVVEVDFGLEVVGLSPERTVANFDSGAFVSFGNDDFVAVSLTATVLGADFEVTNLGSDLLAVVAVAGADLGLAVVDFSVDFTVANLGSGSFDSEDFTTLVVVVVLDKALGADLEVTNLGAAAFLATDLAVGFAGILLSEAVRGKLQLGQY